jgi:predicted PurR-regulated permease PerM
MLDVSLIWIPVTVMLIINEQIVSAICVMILHLVASYVIQPLLYSYIPGNPYYITLSAFFGFKVFGIAGKQLDVIFLII